MRTGRQRPAKGARCACAIWSSRPAQPGHLGSHLAELVAAGVCGSEKRGRTVWYSVNPSARDALRAALATG